MCPCPDINENQTGGCDKDHGSWRPGGQKSVSEPALNAVDAAEPR